MTTLTDSAVMADPLSRAIIGMIRTDTISEIDCAVALSVEATIDPGSVACGRLPRLGSKTVTGWPYQEPTPMP